MNSENYFRVVEDRGTSFLVSTDGHKTYKAELDGLLKQKNEIEKPVVGDWVVGDLQPGEWLYIHKVVHRKNILRRKAANEDRRVQHSQNLAANVDFLWILSSLNEDYSLNRIERYVAMAISCNVQPVIILSKVDLVENQVHYVDEVAQRFSGIDVHGVSVTHGWNLECFDRYLLPEKTVALMGSSGVGKSTLINHLMEQNILKTQEVREDIGTGRHTTTTRSLHRLPQGAWLMDTPGLRSLALWDGENGLQTIFADIESISLRCRFSNCTHQTEPGCAIQEALTNHALSQERWENYLKLMKEQNYLRRKEDLGEAMKHKNRWKSIAKERWRLKKIRERE